MEQTALGRDVSSMFVKTDFFKRYCPGLEAPPEGWDNIHRVIPDDVMTGILILTLFGLYIIKSLIMGSM